MQLDLTKQEIKAIEAHIEEIDRALDVLDPANALEAQEIERKAQLLRSYITLLDSSHPTPGLRALSN